MKTDGFALYKKYLCRRQSGDLFEDKRDILQDFAEEIVNNPAYQSDAKRNGETQPVAIKRKNTSICEFTVMPGDEMYIGDLIEVLGEKWLVTDLRSDEYGMLYGECWMCNICLCFQTNTTEVFERYAILDNGSYTDTTGKPVSTADANFICYISKDSETSKFYVDKRLALDKAVDKDGKTILTVGRISWIDGKSENYGDGAHLLKFRLDNDIFNPTKDNVELMVCDYIDDDSKEEDDNSGLDDTDITDEDNQEESLISITGSNTLRIGATRTYEAVFSSNENISESPKFSWGTSLNIAEIIVSEDSLRCVIKIPLDSTYIGTGLEIYCEDLNGLYGKGVKRVVIIANG